ncbi:MAG TPA: 5-oxoprolinase subunit PxpB [Gemmatimonadaceae bacterium]|nr:5-oxoprolinase subunit PxpB [Gemmatimonadaceae bacterium]
MTAPAILPLGETALTIRLAETASIEVAEQCAEIAERIRAAGIDGVREVVSAIASVTVFAGDRIPVAGLRAELERVLAHTPSGATTTRTFATHTIPTRYDGVDLDEVAERVKLDRDEVIRRHASREYRVLSIGFMPGWGYLGPLDAALALPRRSTPRTRIPAGAVAIMGAQTGIYPRVSPGGWNLIGTTNAVLFDATRTQPALFRAGDRVRFAQIS